MIALNNHKFLHLIEYASSTQRKKITQTQNIEKPMKSHSPKISRQVWEALPISHLILISSFDTTLA